MKAAPMPAENVYGHRKRLDWVIAHTAQGDRILEFGCGTGYMLTIPLLMAGYDAVGVDLDRASIEYGQRILAELGLPISALRAQNVASIDGRFQVVVASEVFEHLSDNVLVEALALLRSRIDHGGRLLVTVPNGYGWFEFESFVWNRLGLGWLLHATRIDRLFEILKLRVCGDTGVYLHPSTLSSSGHLQRFTSREIRRRLQDAGFVIHDLTGTVMFAGPVSNMLFSGCGLPMRLNAWLGSRFPNVAVAFMVTCTVARREGHEQ